MAGTRTTLKTSKEKRRGQPKLGMGGRRDAALGSGGEKSGFPKGFGRRETTPAVSNDVATSELGIVLRLDNMGGAR